MKFARIESLGKRIFKARYHLGAAAPSSWQCNKKNSDLKASLIVPELEATNSFSILDIGCNAGQVTRLLSHGRFAVGIDQTLDTRGFDQPFKGVALGELPIDSNLIKKLPDFDAVLLLSVHHQWYANFPLDQADNLFKQVALKARNIFVVEFAAIRSKYGMVENEFIDNDPESIKSFAESFLKPRLPNDFMRIEFLGRVPELQQIEPYRYMYAAYRNPLPSS